ncbi:MULTISPECIES: DUF262 domain-containing protein [unclassified Mesorhizobium]|uniref:DUF262 domain-containing protein n=1 Tax=unclassified Mesorhizobium TaxID=325217 RepID=UPI001CCDBD16|nr:MULTISPECIES: DUF262 domain-containing protein [unclassified Mesorhizobium]MBZ9916584.1 DUF262 domain-containing HNH endonuclease family protein [Mesorhizobium sp. BR1-1-7]MBZ9952875.1 DUF262 domain-containing HNH endonuclease family protein [Mesorhizobium sp. BR1-1-15]MBZ9972598.1 DUF262 domain-containing HNH endonuclease family protein [Mesorhizobium sp. BR1-1-12]
MQPAYHPLANIFGTQTRHLVPLFQRPYVWSREEQWEPLWDDLAHLADRLLTANGKKVAGHFLGTVVLEQADTPSGRVTRREVIDGQQRLTTLQIVLQAAKHAFGEIIGSGNEPAEKAAGIEVSRLEALTLNPPGYEEEEKYKVWPTNEDRAAFRQVMDAPGPQDLVGVRTRMAEAYAFFVESMRNWLDKGPAEQRVPALSSALKDHLRLIVLDLDSSDEPQAIFETLNAHGTPLLPADLIKNWLLWQFARRNDDAAAPYDKYWSSFDRDPGYWRQKIGTGHAARARVDTFLQNWLICRVRHPISASHLYDQFLKYAQSRVSPGDMQSVHDFMNDIQIHGSLFRQIDQPVGHSRFATFCMRLKPLDMSVFQPVLMAVMRREGSTDDDQDSVAAALESYLVRRMICGGQTRGYGNLAIDLIGIIHSVNSAEPVGAAISNYLGALEGALWWPDDERFRLDWCSRVFYSNLRRARVLMILQALEEHYQTPGALGEPVVGFDFAKLTIEHIMPQKWRDHWPFDGDESGRVNRDRALHGIGNLTLVSNALNPSLSNSAWTMPPRADGKPNGKSVALKAHSKLQLNAKLLDRWPDVWSEAQIIERANALFETALLIWPRPSAGEATQSVSSGPVAASATEAHDVAANVAL